MLPSHEVKKLSWKNLKAPFQTCSPNTGLMNDCMAREIFAKPTEEFAVSTCCLRCWVADRL